MEVFGGASRSTASSGGFSPIHVPGCRFTWSPRLLLLELLPPSASGCGSFRCPSCSFYPASAWFSSETSASWVLTVASAPDSERTFAFGRSLCSVSGSPPSSLVASWCGGLGACLPFFPFPFPFGVVVTPGLMDWELEGFFPSGCFLFRLWGLPCLRSGGGRQGRQCLAGPSVLRDGCLVPVLLEYCSPVWMSATDSNLNVLSKIVRSAGFLFPGNSNYDLDHRRNISSLCLFHKIYFNDDHPLHHLIPDPYVPSRQTRFSNQQHQYSVCEARCNTVQFQRSFFPYSAKLWNGLQPEVVDECMGKFKTACNRTLK